MKVHSTTSSENWKESPSLSSVELNLYHALLARATPYVAYWNRGLRAKELIAGIKACHEPKQTQREGHFCEGVYW